MTNKKETNVATEIANRHFGKRVVKALAKQGIEFLGMCVIPSAESADYANGETGYQISDNGTGRLLTAVEILKVVK